MLISEPLPFVNEFLDALDTALKVHKPLTPGLSRTQRSWLGFCVMGILITNTVCWAQFERASLGQSGAVCGGGVIVDVSPCQDSVGALVARECGGDPPSL